jgi:hypothetical protein
MNFSARWDASAAARWERWRRKSGKLGFVLLGGLGFGAAQMAANIPTIIIAQACSAHALVAKVVLSIGVFGVLGSLINFVTWNRMETGYRDYLSRA